MKVLKILGILIACVILLVIIGITYIKVALPNVGDAPELTVKSTPEVLARGEYLANHVAICVDCHSTRDWSKFAAPLVPGTFGQGGELFNHDFGLPGEFPSKNITPAGIKDWTDGELYRLITTGVTKNGDAIFPIMPYSSYGQIASEDIEAIIAYVRSLDPIANEVPTSKADFPMNIILNTIPQPAIPQPIPDKSDQIAYGKYVMTVAACSECHTPQDDKGNRLMDKYMAGGFEFKLPGYGVVRSANITPDAANGIGSWNEDFFVKRFKAYADSSYVPHEVAKGEFQTVMPWMMYAGMEEEDLKAIYAYLTSLDPNPNKIEKFTSEVTM